jgi:hypothetical protein
MVLGLKVFPEFRKDLIAPSYRQDGFNVLFSILLRHGCRGRAYRDVFTALSKKEYESVI